MGTKASAITRCSQVSQYMMRSEFLVAQLLSEMGILRGERVRSTSKQR